MPEQHSYLKTHRLAGAMVSLDLQAEEAKLRALAAGAGSGRAAKTLLKQGRMRVTLVALRRGAELSAHQVEGDVTLHVLRGEFEVRTKQRGVRAAKGGMLALQAGLSHEARALRDSTVLITAAMS
jgi:quercetin dioxygenase-like cupin family protein